MSSLVAASQKQINCPPNCESCNVRPCCSQKEQETKKMIRSEDRKVVSGWTDCTGGLTEVDGRTAMMKGDRLIPSKELERADAPGWPIITQHTMSERVQSSFALTDSLTL